MKKLIISIILSLGCLMNPAARAEKSAQLFDCLASLPDAEYVYISPESVAKAKSRKQTDGKLFNGLPVELLTSAEILTLRCPEESEFVQETIDKVVLDKELDLVSTNSTGHLSSKFYARWNSEKDLFTDVLLLKFNSTDNMLHLLFLSGDLDPVELRRFF